MNPVLLYDGQCGMCTDGVQRVLRHDHQGTLRFAPLQGTFAATVKARHPELDSVDSMVWVEPAGDGSEQLFIRSSAGLRIARYLGGDALYDFVARHRHTIAGRSDHCLVPTPEIRSRFLE